jgi:hypothetical protein
MGVLTLNTKLTLLSACKIFAIHRLTTVQVGDKVIIVILNLCVTDVVNIDMSHVYRDARGY